MLFASGKDFPDIFPIDKFLSSFPTLNVVDRDLDDIVKNLDHFDWPVGHVLCLARKKKIYNKMRLLGNENYKWKNVLYEKVNLLHKISKKAEKKVFNILF